MDEYCGCTWPIGSLAYIDNFFLLLVVRLRNVLYPPFLVLDARNETLLWQSHVDRGEPGTMSLSLLFLHRRLSWTRCKLLWRSWSLEIPPFVFLFAPKVEDSS
jgi:hypothetical protein